MEEVVSKSVAVWPKSSIAMWKAPSLVSKVSKVGAGEDGTMTMYIWETPWPKAQAAPSKAVAAPSVAMGDTIGAGAGQHDHCRHQENEQERNLMIGEDGSEW